MSNKLSLADQIERVGVALSAAGMRPSVSAMQREQERRRRLSPAALAATTTFGWGDVIATSKVAAVAAVTGVHQNEAKAVRIQDLSRGQDGALPGYYIVSGEGLTYRCFMWAADMKRARKALAQVRRELRTGAAL